jgi:hypothetical protein
MASAIASTLAGSSGTSTAPSASMRSAASKTHRRGTSGAGR